MITEDYVSFETAKLLKEKGFNEQSRDFYRFENNIWIHRNTYEYHYFNLNMPGWKNCYSCPTLQMAMKWLREVHKIHIQIWIMEGGGYWFDIEKILNAQYKHTGVYSTGLEDIYFETYEEATEAAIKYSLENLI